MKNLWLIVVLLMVGTTGRSAPRQTRRSPARSWIVPARRWAIGDAGYKLTGTSTAKGCSEACVKSGSKYVLYNASTKTVYELDNLGRAQSTHICLEK
jgi:hypothetical protein